MRLCATHREVLTIERIQGLGGGGHCDPMAIISGHGRRSLGLLAGWLLHHCPLWLSLVHSFGANAGRGGSDEGGHGWGIFRREFGRSDTAVQFASQATISAVVVDLGMKATIMMIRLLLLLELLLLLQNHRTRAERRRPKNKAIIFSCKHLQRSSSTRNTHHCLKTAQRVFSRLPSQQRCILESQNSFMNDKNVLLFDST